MPPKHSTQGGKIDQSNTNNGPAHEKDILRPSDGSTPQTAPGRAASQRLVGRGVELLEAQSYDQASSTLRDAINVDSTNGAAYYYLAEAYAGNEENDLALGILDKAEALFKNDASWIERINALKVKLGGTPTITGPTPIDSAF